MHAPSSIMCTHALTQAFFTHSNLWSTASDAYGESPLVSCTIGARAIPPKCGLADPARTCCCHTAAS